MTGVLSRFNCVCECAWRVVCDSRVSELVGQHRFAWYLKRRIVEALLRLHLHASGIRLSSDLRMITSCTSCFVKEVLVNQLV